MFDSAGFRFREFNFQNQRNPSRCQRRMVSGFTSSTASRQPRTMLANKTIKPRSWGLNTGRLTFLVATISCCLSRAFSAMSWSRDLVKSRISPTTTGNGRIASCSKLFVLTAKRLSPVRIRASVDNTAGWFCSKSGNRSSLAEIRKFNDHVAEESNSQHRLLISQPTALLHNGTLPQRSPRPRRATPRRPRRTNHDATLRGHGCKRPEGGNCYVSMAGGAKADGV